MCEAIRRGINISLRWAMRNDCQGLFDTEVFDSREDCERAFDDHSPYWREWRNALGDLDGRAVPVVVIQIPKGHPANPNGE